MTISITNTYLVVACRFERKESPCTIKNGVLFFFRERNPLAMTYKKYRRALLRFPILWSCSTRFIKFRTQWSCWLRFIIFRTRRICLLRIVVGRWYGLSTQSISFAILCLDALYFHEAFYIKYIRFSFKLYWIKVVYTPCFKAWRRQRKWTDTRDFLCLTRAWGNKYFFLYFHQTRHLPTKWIGLNPEIRLNPEYPNAR